ncbi:hypothetical protein [Yoonia sp. 2307UL14-13]|uniref:hypothetical protein n=1 Tax=Yoonia sp. 2307UL14-13 TaxID=3126506 RepID=UPI0030A8C7F4
MHLGRRAITWVMTFTLLVATYALGTWLEGLHGFGPPYEYFWLGRGLNAVASVGAVIWTAALLRVATIRCSG